MAYDNLKLDKDLYTTNKSFTEALEELDSSENYIGTELEGLDAYARQLKRFHIKVSGEDVDTVSKFFQTSDSSVLFPEYVLRTIKSEMDKESTYEDFYSVNTKISTTDYRSIRFYDIYKGEDEATKVLISSDLIQLRKNNQVLLTSYESIKYQSLSLFEAVLKHIGKKFKLRELSNLYVYMLSTSDYCDFKKVEDLSWHDIQTLDLLLKPSYNLTTLFMPVELSVLKSFETEMGYKICNPYYFNDIRIIPERKGRVVIGFDKNYAIEKVSSDIQINFDRLIDCDFENTVISQLVGFNTISPSAIKAIRLV